MHQQPTTPDADLGAGDLLRLLAEPDRLRVCAALVLGAANRQEVVEATGLTERHVDKALARLLAGGLVVRAEGGLRLVTEHLEQATRSSSHPRPPGDEPAADLSPDAARVFRSFVRNGRLTSIPASRSKRLVLLDWLAQRFDPGRRYPEREVNRILGAVHPDVAALRRYLVDEGLLARDAGEYWRVGGTFHVDTVDG